jgi:hypothetical protein
MEIDTKGFALGDIARDTVTGLVGTITGIHQYLTGCARVSLQPPAADGKVPEHYGADVLTLELVEAGPRHAIDVTAGGPRKDPGARAMDPRR